MTVKKTSSSCVISAVDVDLSDLDNLEERRTLHFLRAVSGTLPEPERCSSSVRGGRIVADFCADEAARLEHRQRVVAPLLMLVALGLLVAAAGSSC